MGTKLFVLFSVCLFVLQGTGKCAGNNGVCMSISYLQFINPCQIAQRQQTVVGKYKFLSHNWDNVGRRTHQGEQSGVYWVKRKKGEIDSQQSQSPANRFAAPQIESPVTTRNKRGQAPSHCKGHKLLKALPHPPSAQAS